MAMTAANIRIINQSTVSDLDISLHPLPILNVSDHLTRTQLQSDRSDIEIYGALIGTQLGKKLEVVNCFEILIDSDGKVDHGFLKTRREQFQQVFPTLDLLGWYTNAKQPRERDLKIFNQLTESTDVSGPILLLYHPASIIQSSSTTNKELPIQIYEFTQSTGASEGQVFVKCTYDVQTSEAERIAVDYVAKPNAGSKESGLVAHLVTQRNAIQMLHHKLDSIVDYLDELMNTNWDSKTSQPNRVDHGLLRQISSLVASLPRPDENPSFNNEYMIESNDALLKSYLSSQSKVLSETNQLIDRYVYLNTRESTSTKAGSASSHNSHLNKPLKVPK